ncbi:rhamnogalacturonan lyase [Kineococcus arenarius]|uniref:rhamnogalacturonan lyase n=1 Tax=unclassified Kineococcus TaxID=2621656 RepID=UPI003D7E1A5F
MGRRRPTPEAARRATRAAATALTASGLAAALLAAPTAAGAGSRPDRLLEDLDRGVVAVPTDGGYLVSWRLLAGDRPGTGFEVRRDGRVVATLDGDDATNVVDPDGRAGARYEVVPLRDGHRAGEADSGTAWSAASLDVPLDRPAGGTTPAGEVYTYSANDVSVGDLDGDGDYELVLKWYPSNAKDNSQDGYTGNVLIDAYTLQGEKLWRIDLGRNVRAGAHYTQVAVQDFDGDGRSEVALKTADGTVDGRGRVIGDPGADHRNGVGRVLSGPEFLSVFDGRTGGEIDTVAYVPARHPDTDDPTPQQMKELWGDDYGNRIDRFLGGTASFDGRSHSIVMARGYYTRAVVAAWDLRGGRLHQRWVFDTEDPALGPEWEGQGNHQFSVADVDADGRDEVVYGSIAIDDDGTGLWNAGLGHGDALHVGDLDPARPGLERFGVHECMTCSGGVGASMLDAATGEVLWTTPADADNGRGLSADVDPSSPGSESWSSRSPGLYAADGEKLTDAKPGSINHAVWWDGDRQRELLDGTTISEWDPATGTTVPLLAAEGVVSNNGTKANPSISGDLLGDWREEVVLPTTDSSALRVFATTFPTEERITTLVHDRTYRAQLASQNSGYNQPPHTGTPLG